MKKFCLIAMLLVSVPALTQGLPEPVTILPGDLSGDSVVGTDDLMQLLSLWGSDYRGLEAGPCSNAQAVECEGYEYDLVEIGSQCWFAQNLRTTHYANGDAIPGNLSDAQWASTGSGAQTVYGEGSSTVYDGSEDEVANLATYGRLYNWYAVDDLRGLCPSGWHVPTDGEWTELTDFLGGSSVAGTALKSSPSDEPSWNGTNTSGFSALPGGLRGYYDGSFYYGGFDGFWWSASPNGTSHAWYRNLYSDNDFVLRFNSSPRGGQSVRCLRDE